MLKLVDRYILKEVTPPFFLGLTIFSFALLMNELLQVPERYIAEGVPLSVTLKLLALLIPSVLAFTVPMSVLVGILAGLGRLSSDSEITAFRTLGIGHLRLARPLLLFAFGGWVVTSVLTLDLAPRSNFKWLQTLADSRRNKISLEFRPREFNESISNVVLFIRDVDQKKDWTNAFLYFSDTPEKPRIVLARHGRLNLYPKSKRAILELQDALEHSVALDDPDTYSVTFLGRIEEEINVENLFSAFTAEKLVREKNIVELRRGLRAVKADLTRLEAERKDIDRRGLQKDAAERVKNRLSIDRARRESRSHRVEIQKRFALPFACWIFVFLGLPLGSSTRKGGRTSGFTVSLLIILIYYIGITAGEKMALDGRFPPWLGMWGPNILLGLFALFLFSQSAQEFPGRRLFPRRLRAAGPTAPGPTAAEPTEAASKKTAIWRWPRVSLAFPNILDRYIIRRFLFIWSLVLASLILISCVVTFFDRIGHLYEHNKPLAMLFAYTSHRIPEFVHFGLPVASLMATLLTLGLLMKSNEITAMKASGISLYRIVAPIVLLALLAAALAFHIQENVLPRANKKAEESLNRIDDKPPRSYSYENRRWVSNKAGTRFFHYGYFDPKSSTFGQLSIFDLDLDNWTITRRYYAQKAYLVGQSLRLEDGWRREFTGEIKTEYERRPSMELPLEEGQSFFVREWKEPSQMNYAELRAYIGEVKEMGFDTTTFRVDLGSKISFPFVALIMTFLGIPFAFSMGKRGALVGIGISLAIAIVYWVTIGIFRSLGNVGSLSVFFAAWGPNLIFGLGGLYLLLRLRT